jgi:hypothetical protein
LGRLLLKKLALPVLSSLIVGGVGMTAGYRLGWKEGMRSNVVSQVSASAQYDRPRAVNPASPVMDPPIAPPDVELPAVAPVVSVPSTAGSPASAPTSPGVEVPGMSAQDEELFQVKRVQRALRDGNGALALAILNELDQTQPRGRLTEERQAARLMAGCLQGQDVSAARARFFSRYPSSIYISRINERCPLAGSSKSTTEYSASATEPRGAGQD